MVHRMPAGDEGWVRASEVEARQAQWDAITSRAAKVAEARDKDGRRRSGGVASLRAWMRGTDDKESGRSSGRNERVEDTKEKVRRAPLPGALPPPEFVGRLQ